MDGEKKGSTGATGDVDNPDRTGPGGFQEAPATQGLKKAPEVDPGEESGEWTRGGGTNPDEGTANKPDDPHS